MSDNTQADHQDTADHKLQQDDGCEALQSGTGKIAVKGLNTQGNGCQKHNPAKERYHLQWNSRKRGDVADGIFEKAPERPF